MALREVLLLGSLAAVGTVGFVHQRARTRERLDAMLAQERRLRGEIRALRARRRHLKKEIRALDGDPYYIERVARALGYHSLGGPAPPDGSVPLGLDPTALARGGWVPLEGPGGGGVPDTVEAPALPPGEQARQTLARLGYDTLEHFQRKMMSSHNGGVLDAPTLGRLRALLALLGRSGCPSVKAFQARHGLTADGILGRLTERRMEAIASCPAPKHPPAPRSGVVVHSGDTGRTSGGGG